MPKGLLRPPAKPPSPKVALAAQMRADGATTEEIMEKCGYKTPQGACKAARSGLQYKHFEDVQRARLAAEKRFDAIAAELWRVAKDPDSKPSEKVSALRVLAQVEAGRREMFGLNMPKFVARPDVPVPTQEMTDEQLAAECVKYGIPVPPGMQADIDERRRQFAEGTAGLTAGPARDPAANPPHAAVQAVAMVQATPGATGVSHVPASGSFPVPGQRVG